MLFCSSCFLNLFKTVCSILEVFPSGLFFGPFIKMQVVHLYSSIDTVTAWKYNEKDLLSTVEKAGNNSQVTFSCGFIHIDTRVLDWYLKLTFVSSLWTLDTAWMTSRERWLNWMNGNKVKWRCLWCNCYRRRKWTRRHEFKSWTRVIAFHIALIPLGKVWLQFSFQL